MQQDLEQDLQDEASVGQECPLLPDGDLAITNYRGFVSCARLSLCRYNKQDRRKCIIFHR